MLFIVPRGVKNLSEQEFGSLVPQSIVRIVPGEGALWLCKCSCGEMREVLAAKLKAGEVTCCRTCMRAKRATQLRDASARAHETRVVRHTAGMSDYELRWEFYLARMNREQRAIYDDLIRRRERGIFNVEITDRIRAGAVDVAMRTRAA
jgi:hypothetical protein